MIHEGLEHGNQIHFSKFQWSSSHLIDFQKTVCTQIIFAEYQPYNRHYAVSFLIQAPWISFEIHLERA